MDMLHASMHGSPKGAQGRVERNSLRLLELPDELLLLMLSFLPARDICAVAQTCRRLHNLALSRMTQCRATFGPFWPELKTKHIFERAAHAGNFEAAVKLGVACLYGEGVPASSSSAGKFLCDAEEAVAISTPFTWLLYRPPWSSDTCSKACIYRDVRRMVDQELGPISPAKAAHLLYCAAKVLALKDPLAPGEAITLFQQSLDLGCGDAAHELVTLNSRLPQPKRMSDSQRLEVLSLGAERGSALSKLALFQEYLRGNTGHVPLKARLSETQTFVQGCSMCKRRRLVDQPDLDRSGKMRFILVDWLVEVVELKGFSRETLYCAIELVDRYLETCSVTRRTLQLLGISCMVTAARYLEDDVITIREASWLTDHTYTYEQIVRTIGQILFVMRGTVRATTHHDFLKLFFTGLSRPREQEDFIWFLSELAFLHFDSATYAPPLLAAAVYFLGLVTTKHQLAWPTAVREFTGLSIFEFESIVMDLYERIFHRQPIRDHRNVELSDVRARYLRRFGQEVPEGFIPQESDVKDAIARCKAMESRMDATRGFVRISSSSSSSCASSALRQITNTPVLQTRKGPMDATSAMEVDDETGGADTPFLALS